MICRQASIKQNKESRTQSTHRRRRPWAQRKKLPCCLPLRTTKTLFFINFFDLPCKRTCHGKGRMTKNGPGLSLSSRFLIHPDSKFPPELTNYNDSNPVTPVIVPTANMQPTIKSLVETRLDLTSKPQHLFRFDESSIVSAHHSCKSMQKHKNTS